MLPNTCALKSSDMTVTVFLCNANLHIKNSYKTKQNGCYDLHKLVI